MKHLSILDTLTPVKDPVVLLSQEEFQDNIIATEAMYSEILTLSKETDQGLDIVNALESLSEVISQIKILKPSHIALIQIAGNLAVSGTDICSESLIPSLESMDDKQSSGPRLKEKITAILKAISVFIKRIWEGFKKLLVWLAEASTSYVANAATYRTRTNKISSNKVIKDDKTFKSPGIFYNGDILKNHSSLISMLSKYPDEIKKLEQEASKVGNGLIITANKISDIITNKSKQSYDVSRSLYSEYESINEINLVGGFSIVKNDWDLTDIENLGDDSELHVARNVEHICRLMRLSVQDPAHSDYIEYNYFSKQDLDKVVSMYSKIAQINGFPQNTVKQMIKEAEDNIKKIEAIFEKALKEPNNNSKQENESLQWGLKLPTAFLATTSNFLTSYSVLVSKNTVTVLMKLGFLIDRNLNAYGV